ncbi:MAG: hypothetical protein IPL49_21000 [Saprospirales bacterium]|nr:hypothetical protein [Saprospirales bacterium]
MVTYKDLPPDAKVWIYQSNRPFTDAELKELEPQIQTFADEWVSHNVKLKSFGAVYLHRFIVLMVDENQAGASGCSIDRSVYFPKLVERNFGVELFDRQTFAFRQGDEVRTVPSHEFARLYQSGAINDETLVFDNLVSNKETFDKAWIKPLGESWHKRLV